MVYFVPIVIFRVNPEDGDGGDAVLARDAIGQAAKRMRYRGPVRCAWPQTAAHQSQRKTLGFQRLDRSVFQAVPEQGDQRLRARINAQVLPAKSQRLAALGEGCGREFPQ